MTSTNVDFNLLAQHGCQLLQECTKDNERVENLFLSADGYNLVLDSLKKVAELAAKKVKNTKKSHEFAIWYANEYESRTGKPAPDKVVNLTKEICCSLLTPYKRLFFC